MLWVAERVFAIPLTREHLDDPPRPRKGAWWQGVSYMQFPNAALTDAQRDAIYPMPRPTYDRDEWRRLFHHDVPDLDLAALEYEQLRLCVRLVLESDPPSPWLVARHRVLRAALDARALGLSPPPPPDPLPAFPEPAGA